MPTLNTSNPLVNGLVFIAPFQENILPYTDDAGARVVSAVDATIQLSAPGPALAITSQVTSKAQSSTTPISAPPYTMAIMAYRGVQGTSLQCAFSWSRDDAEYVTLGFTGATASAGLRGGGSIVDTLGSTCAAGAWHNLAFIVPSNTSRSIYANGVVTAGSATAATIGGTYFTPLTMGALQRGSLGANLGAGYLRWAVIWNRVLTTAELDTFFANPSAVFVSTAFTFTGPVPAQSGTAGSASTTLALAGYFSGGTTPYAYSVFSGVLPPGLTLSSSTGQITGTPTAAGSYSAVVRATDAAAATANTGTISWTIAAVAATITTLAGPTSGTVGAVSAAFSMGLNGTGTATITPNDGAAGGTFSPSGAQSVTYPATATFTYTAASVGTKTISTTNGGGLANATPISYVANTAQGRLLLTANPGDEVRAFGSGALLATLAYDLWVHHPTTGALVVKLSGVTDAAGLLGVVTNPTMGLSTQYRIDYKFSTGEFGSCYRTTEAT